jgi:hypothetical protein
MTRNGAVNNQLTFEEGGRGEWVEVTVNLLICDRRGSLLLLAHSLIMSLPSTTYLLAV